MIDGKYEIVRQIGRGGMSCVYLAVDLRLRKKWAVKVIPKNEGERGKLCSPDSLKREAELMKRLDHPAFPRIVDQIDTGRALYLVMDYIAGKSLGQILKEDGAQPEIRVIRWGIQLAEALVYLHTRKPPIIYRDLKPSNVILTTEGSLKLIDLGIARAYRAKGRPDTAALGTQGYAPPEQHGLRQTDARSDIYALGMTLHHLLTGMDPGKPGYQYVSACRANPRLSKRMGAIVDRCTSLDPAGRYPDCEALLCDLRGAALAKQTPGQKRRRTHKITAVWAGMLLLAACGVAGQVYVRSGAERFYEEKLDTVGTHAEKVRAYLEAIDLRGADSRAYRELLKECRMYGEFTEEESLWFSERYSENQEHFGGKDNSGPDLTYEAGITYLYFYTGGDRSFRSRLFYAKPYFDRFVKDADRGDPRIPVAKSFQVLADFCCRYTPGAAQKEDSDRGAGLMGEPKREAYEALLDAVCSCLDGVDGYAGADAASVRLVFYREIANLINDCRRGFAVFGIDQESVLGILQKIKDRTQGLTVTQDGLAAMQKAVLASCREYADRVARAYANEEEREE